MEFEILSSGYRDLAEGRDFYDMREPGLGDYFLSSVFTKIESLRLYAGIHRKILGYHRVLVQNFPYAIYYKIEREVVMIYRVLDCRSDPGRIKDALQ